MAKEKKKKKLNKVVKRVAKQKKVKKPVIKKVLVAKKTKPVKKTVLKKKIITKKVTKKPNSNPVLRKSRPVMSKVPKKISKKTEISAFPAESLFKARIKVIGIGGGGGSIVSEIGRSIEKAHFVVADTDIRALKKKSGIKYFWFGEDQTHGLGTGVNIDLARQAAEGAREKISANFKDQDIVIFIASLGGGLGSGATQIFAEAAREFGGITFGIFTLPFKFEGKNKQRIALNALKSLRKILNVSLVIPNEKIFKIIDANTAITNAFSIVNKSLIESLESLIDLIYNPGIINIDFADLRTILRGIGNTAFLNTVEESGKDRAEKICHKVMHNTLLQDNRFEAEKILFNIAGSENLSMFEVEKISSHIANLNPKAKIIFGISKNQKLKNKIKTTILMTGGQSKEEAPIIEFVKKSEPIGFVDDKELKVPERKEKIKEKKPKVKIDKPAKKKKSKKKKETVNDAKPKAPEKKESNPISIIPVFNAPTPSVPVVAQNKISISVDEPALAKQTIRRSGLEIRKAEEQAEKKRIDQEKEWEIPAFLRKVKFKN